MDQSIHITLTGFFLSILFLKTGWLDFGLVHRAVEKIHNHAKEIMKPVSSHLDLTSLVNKGFIISLVKFINNS